MTNSRYWNDLLFNVNCENDSPQSIYFLRMDYGQVYYKHQGPIFNVIVKIVSESVYDILLERYQDDE